MPGVRKKPMPSGCFQGWYRDYKGRRLFFKGTHSRAETEQMAMRLEDENRQIKLNYRPVPKLSDTARLLEFKKVMDEYLDWGRAQGGVRGRPWAKAHAEKREAGLKWWVRELSLQVLADLDGALPRVEKALRKMQANDLSNLTIHCRSSCLTALCSWAEDRGYLSENPLKALVPYPKEAKSVRRAMTPEEVQLLLEHCRPKRRLTYEVALGSGLRAKELRSLKVADLDVERGGLQLRKSWTKNRRDGFQPLPVVLVAKLAEVAKTRLPSALLLRVGTQPARDLATDLKRSGLKKETADGKLDFHALRVAYTTFVIESGANIKEAQALARHSTPELTLNVYARARNQRLAQLAEAVGRVTMGTANGESRTGTAHN
jgi:integrase